MVLSTKIKLGAILLSVIPAVVAILMVGWSNYYTSEQLFEAEAKQKLISLREEKKSSIESYFQKIIKQVKTFSEDFMITYAMQQFKNNFHGISDDYTPYEIEQMRNELKSYYTDQFAAEYHKLNNNDVNVNPLIDELEADTVYQQYRYIQKNSNPLGSKDQLDKAPEGLAYDNLHNNFHPIIRNYLAEFGYYDIFLVDHETGHIVYSVFKELDYGTSLIDGPYANTGIGQAFAGANALTASNEFYLTDFAPYGPSYEAPASFIASPIYSNGNNGEKIGILIFQMPVDEINAVMTYNQNWQEVGLGETGETYLVGQDMTMRSLGRYLIDDKAGYLQALKKTNMGASDIALIDKKETTIGLQPVATPGVKAALQGKSEYQIFKDYRGVSVLSAYSPVEIPGLNWVIMSEIDEAEAFAPVYALISSMKNIAIGMCIFMCVVGAGLGWWFSEQALKPIRNVIKLIRNLTDNVDNNLQQGDFTQRVVVNEAGEIGDLADGVNGFIEQTQSMVTTVKNCAQDVSDNAKNVFTLTEAANSAMISQKKESESVTVAVTEMNQTTQDVSNSARVAAESAQEADEVAKQGTTVIADSIQTFRSLADEVEQTTSLIQVLEKDSENIGSVLNVIRDIAEQTNLLALNAAIEAARAGEQGRGFAVVADEVRTLASRTQESTQEIQAIIESLQSRSSEAVKAMEHSSEQAKLSIEKTAGAGDALDSITNKVAEIDHVNVQIANAASEQTKVTDEVNRNIININDLTDESAASLQNIVERMEEMKIAASSLEMMMSQYKV